MSTTVIEKLSHDGRGIARIEGKTTFIRGALPGETVEFHYRKRKRDFDEGEVSEIFNASINRVTPPCPNFGLCGGCSLQHLAISAQVAEKEMWVIDLLARIGHCAPKQILAPLEADPLHYRQKARLSVRYAANKESALVGFREKNNPRFVMDMSDCSILDARVSASLPALRKLISSFEKPESIAQVEVAVGDDAVALVFRHLQALSLSDQEKLTAFGEVTTFRLFLQPEGVESIALFYPSDASPLLTYSLPSEGISFAFHPNDFTQINGKLNRLMVPYALTFLDLQADDCVLDLFCGLGNFSLPMAKHCQKVIGIEGSHTMVQRAADNARRNHIQNATFLAENLEESANISSLHAWGATKLMLDPPRVGAFELVKQIERLQLKRIVYVSCNPSTLARDAGVLVNEKGYELQDVMVMDMFPHTEHVETMALFVKK